MLQNILNIIKEHGFDINEFNIVLFINQTLLEFKSLQKAPDGLCFIQVLCTILDQIKQSHHDQYLTIEYVKQKLQDIDKKSRKPLFTNKNLEILFIGIGKMLEERTNPYGIPSSSSVLIDILETKSDEFEKQIICLKKDNTELKSLVIEGNNKIKTYESKIFNSKQRIEEQQTKIQCLTTENIQLNLKILMFTNNNRKDNQ